MVRVSIVCRQRRSGLISNGLRGELRVRGMVFRNVLAGSPDAIRLQGKAMEFPHFIAEVLPQLIVEKDGELVMATSFPSDADIKKASQIWDEHCRELRCRRSALLESFVGLQC